MKKIEQFLSDYLGQTKGYPTDSQYPGQCLSIVKLYIKECFGIDPPSSGTGSAYGYWSNFPSPLGTVFEKVENTDDLIPEKGWIGIMEPWDSNPYGHIFIVADGSTKSVCKNWAQNWTSKVFQLESNKYTHIVGFLKPKDVIINNSDPIMTTEEQNIWNFIKTNQITEGQLREGYGYVKDGTVSNLTKQIADLNTSQKDLEDRISQLEADAKANNDLIVGWQEQVTSANQTISKIQADLDSANSQSNVWKNRYEAALKEQVGKYTAWELIVLGVKSLFKK